MKTAMNSTHKDPETLSFLQKVVRESSMQQLTRYCRDLSITIKECTPEVNQGSFGDEISLIFLWSGIGSIVFKVHFSMAVCLRWTSHALQKEPSAIDPNTARDFMKEFNNIMGGFLRGTFEKLQIQMGMGLPFLAPGHDEAIFHKIRDPRSHTSLWKLSDGKDEVICSSEICLLEPEMIKAVRPELEKLLIQAGLGNASIGEVNFI